jgi:hypothetical protein
MKVYEFRDLHVYNNNDRYLVLADNKKEAVKIANKEKNKKGKDKLTKDDIINVYKNPGLIFEYLSED